MEMNDNMTTDRKNNIHNMDTPTNRTTFDNATI